MREQEIQNQIRLAISQEQAGVAFRSNVGQAWTGESYQRMGSDVLIHQARPFLTGLPKGFSDLFGVIQGGRAFFLEVKTPKGRASEEQEHFLEVMEGWGALSGIVRSPEEALRLLRR